MLTSPGLTMLGFFLVDFPGTIWLAQLNPAVPRFEGVVGGRINVKLEHPVAHPGASGADSPPGEMLDFAEIIFVIYGLWKRSWWKHFLHGDELSSSFFCAFSNCARINHIFTSSLKQERLKCRT